VLAAESPAVVIEANFWPDDPRHEARVKALASAPVEVHCLCPIDECMRRYVDRGTRGILRTSTATNSVFPLWRSRDAPSLSASERLSLWTRLGRLTSQGSQAKCGIYWLRGGLN